MQKATRRPSATADSRQVTRWRSWAGAALLVLLIAIVYWPTLDNGFVSDDIFELKQNVALRSTAGLFDIWFKLGSLPQYYPLTYSVFWAEYHLWQFDWRGFHAVSMLVHAVATLLAWRLLARLAVPGAWWAAALFAVHPIEVESVAWASELKNLLSCALALAAIVAYLRFSPLEESDQLRPRRAGWAYGLAILLYVGALLAKTAVVSVPAVILVIIWWKRGRLTWRDVRPTLPFFAVGLALSIVTIWMESTNVGGGTWGPEFDLTGIDRILVAGRAVWFYAGKLAWPEPLIFIYPRWTIGAGLWWQYLFPIGALAAIAGLWMLRTRIGRGPAAAALIFAGVLLPGLGFIDIYLFRSTFVADHLQYHAGIALIALAVATATFVAGRLPAPARWCAAAAGAVALLSLATVSHERTLVWKDSLTIWQDTARQDSRSWIAQQSLGALLGEQGQHERALRHFANELELCELLAREHPAADHYQNRVAGGYADLASSLRALGRTVEEERSLHKAVDIREPIVRKHPRVTDYRLALAGTYVDRARAQSRLGRRAEAEASFRQAIEMRQQLVRDGPANPQYENQLAGGYVELGIFQRDLGDWAGAAHSFQTAREIRERLVRDHPTNVDFLDGLSWCHTHLGLAQLKLGQSAQAAESYLAAIATRARLLEIDPANARYRNDLAANYVDLGLLRRDERAFDEAAEAFDQAIRTRTKLVESFPAVSEYQDGLAWCFHHLALTQHAAGHKNEAEDACREAVKIRERLVQTHPGRGDYQDLLSTTRKDLANLQGETNTQMKP